MFKPCSAEDDTGLHWLVYEGDAAWGHVHRLTGHGVKHIVLPRCAFIEGTLGNTPSVPTSLAAVDMSKSPQLASYLQRLVRLRDCHAWLSKELTSSKS